MKSTPPALKARFQSLVAKVRGAEPKAMFGQVGAMIAEHMFAGTFEEQIVVRLPAAERALFVRMFGGGPFESMPGRPMREYVAADADVLHDDATLLAWMKRAAAYAKTLPPKATKAGAKKKAVAKRAAKTRTAKTRTTKTRAATRGTTKKRGTKKRTARAR